MMVCVCVIFNPAGKENDGGEELVLLLKQHSDKMISSGTRHAGPCYV